mmetsp:Transcript_59932/g.160489  ORF Transcript_59932/g.160489 Transcript_59932/m.160489 type:complete len:105 (-) Transcript_59932:2612-2926(-)
MSHRNRKVAAAPSSLEHAEDENVFVNALSRDEPESPDERSGGRRADGTPRLAHPTNSRVQAVRNVHFEGQRNEPACEWQRGQDYQMCSCVRTERGKRCRNYVLE